MGVLRWAKVIFFVLYTLILLSEIFGTDRDDINDSNFNGKISFLIDSVNHRSKRQLNESKIVKINNLEEGPGNDATTVTQPGPSSARYRNTPIELPEGYDSNTIPSPKTSKPGALVVNVRVKVKQIVDIDELDEKMTLNIDLALNWQDWFIRAGHAQEFINNSSIENDPDYFRTVSPEFLQKIWTPDLYMERLSKATHAEIMSPKITVRFNPFSGQVTYMSRLRTTVDCDLDFHYYPAETHKCNFNLRSMAHDGNSMKLVWGTPVGVYLADPRASNFDLQLSNYTTLKVYDRIIRVRTYYKLRFTILARRKMSYHMVQTFLPSVFFIVITWLCFLIPSKLVEARIGITMTTLLTLTAMFASVREGSPTVSYVRAIDIWMLACIFFVFLTLLEFTVILWLRRLLKSEPEEKDEENSELEPNPKSRTLSNAEKATEVEVEVKTSHEVAQQRHIHIPRVNTYFEIMEKHAFLIFFLLFLFFNLIFWPWLLISSNYVYWEVNTDLTALEDDDPNEIFRKFDLDENTTFIPVD